MSRFAFALTAALVPAAALGASVDEDNAKDMRCLILTSEMAESEDKDLETAGLIASQYYLGRIDGRSPGADLEKLLVQEAGRIADEERPQLTMACAKHMEERGKHLEAVGNKIAAAS